MILSRRQLKRGFGIFLYQEKEDPARFYLYKRKMPAGMTTLHATFQKGETIEVCILKIEMIMETPEGLALLMAESFKKLSPYIEKHTGLVCPHCVKVCCANKHGTPEREDFTFYRALGAEARPAFGPPDEVCSLLGKTGCELPRRQRPFRCTWYFCEPLLESMRRGGGREYRLFVAELAKLVELRNRLISMDPP